MDLEFLSRVFSSWKGKCYIYRGQIPQGMQPSYHITIELTKLLGTNDFISRVTKINENFVVYLESHHADSADFEFLGEINGPIQGEDNAG